MAVEWVCECWRGIEKSEEDESWRNIQGVTSHIIGEHRAQIWHMRGRIGGVLLSRRFAPQVSSGLEGLTTVFGMGTGVAPPLESPIPLRIDTGKYEIVMCTVETRGFEPLTF